MRVFPTPLPGGRVPISDSIMHILVANDDGIYSPGLRALARAAREFGDVRIVAPDVEQSSMGHAITHSRPLRIRRTPIDDFDAYRVNGTPADCVALGVDGWGGADLVLSGINLGYNLGNSIWHSGTLAAAKQASLLGCRGFALSASTGGDEPPELTVDSALSSAGEVDDAPVSDGGELSTGGELSAGGAGAGSGADPPPPTVTTTVPPVEGAPAPVEGVAASMPAADCGVASASPLVWSPVSPAAASESVGAASSSTGAASTGAGSAAACW